MPLSEHEERILAEIERQLAADDPRFGVRSRRGPVPLASWSRVARLRLAVGLGVLGLFGVVLLIQSIVFAAVGLILILGAILIAATAVREQLSPTPTRTPSPDDAL